MDDDGDGSTVQRRDFVSGFGSMTGGDFAFLGPVTVDGAAGTVTVNGGGSIRLRAPLPFLSGEPTVTLRAISPIPAGACQVSFSDSAGTRTATVSAGAGTKSIVFPTYAGGPLTNLRLACTAGGNVFDWMTVSNGPYTWAPMVDLSATASTTGMPGLGRMAFVRSSYDSSGEIGSLMFAGSDVGGFAWSSDGYAWTTANGTASEWHFGEAGAWDAYAVDKPNVAIQDVLVITGFGTTGEAGGLYRTTNLGSLDQSWSPIYVTGTEISPGAGKHFYSCGEAGTTDTAEGTNSEDQGKKRTASGDLLVPSPADADLVLVASSDPDTTGLYWVDLAAGTIEATPAYPGGGLPTGASPEVIPSALAIDADDAVLLVGYRVRSDEGEASALYACPSDFVSGGDCIEVADDTTGLWVGDVRDIVADPTQPGVFYVADGGQRFDGASCNLTTDWEEPTVYRVTLASDLSTTEVVDTDATAATDTTVDDPSWAVDSSGSPSGYYMVTNGREGCVTPHSRGAYGELLSPGDYESIATNITALAIDPEGEFLFVSFMGTLGRDYGCVPIFRTPLADIAPEATPWAPLQGWTHDAMDWGQDESDPANVAAWENLQRRVSVDPAGSYFDDEPVLETLPFSGVHDLAFTPWGELMVSTSELWMFSPASMSSTGTTLAPGWDTVPTGDPADGNTDLDYIPITLAWDGESGAFQDGTVAVVKTCVGCEISSALDPLVTDLVIPAGMWDVKMARVHGADLAGNREAADRSCEVSMLSSIPRTMSLWTTSTGATEAWAPLRAESTAEYESDVKVDVGRGRGLLYNPDVADTADDWCWDAVMEPGELGGMAGGNYLRDICDASDTAQPCDGTRSPTPDGLWELHCLDSGEHSQRWWSPCDPRDMDVLEVDVFHQDFEEQAVGTLSEVEGYDDQRAVMLAWPGTFTDASVGGEGLWAVRYDSATGMQYTHLTDVDPDDTLCEEVYNFTSRARMDLDLSSLQDTDLDGTIDSFTLWVGVDDGADASCAPLYHVEVDLVTEEATWTAADPITNADTSAGPCHDLDAGKIGGVSVTPDGNRVYLFGGATGGVCAVDVSAWPTWSAEAAVSGEENDMWVLSVLPHPHLTDVAFFTGVVLGETGNPAGTYVLQRRRRYVPAADTWEWSWGSRRLSGNDLEDRSAMTMDWGAGPTVFGQQLYMDRLYVGGGGVWELDIGRE